MNRYLCAAILPAFLVGPAASTSAQSAVATVDEALAAVTASVPTPPIAFVGIAPCRLVDTRGNGFSGAFGPPALVGQPPGGTFRFFPVAGQCGIPASAQALSANFAVTNTTGVGFISVWPAGDPQPIPLVATINYSAAQTIWVANLGSDTVSKLRAMGRTWGRFRSAFQRALPSTGPTSG